MKRENAESFPCCNHFWICENVVWNDVEFGGFLKVQSQLHKTEVVIGFGWKCGDVSFKIHEHETKLKEHNNKEDLKTDLGNNLDGE